MDPRIKQSAKKPSVIPEELSPKVKKSTGRASESGVPGSSRTIPTTQGPPEDDRLGTLSPPMVEAGEDSSVAQLHVSPPSSAGVSIRKQAGSRSSGKQSQKIKPSSATAKLTESEILSESANNSVFPNPNKPEILYKNQSVQTDISVPSNRAYEVTITASVAQGKPAQLISVDRQDQTVIPPTYAESTQIALQLVPKFSGDIYRDVVVSPKGPLDIKTTDKNKKKIAGVFNKFSIPMKNELLSVREKDLNILWGNGDNHNKYDQFIQELRDCQGVKISWSDSSGRTRTMPTPLRRIFKKIEYGLDLGSTHTKIGPALSRKWSGARGYIETDAATALAIICLRRGDHENLARICAGDGGDIIGNLLDDKHIGHGPIFTEPFVWPLLAYGAARVSSEAGNNADRLKSLTKAFANFLRYHRADELKQPYPKMTKAIYKGGRVNGDSLANDPKAFAECIEKLWKSLCPEKPIDDILRIDANELKAKQKLGTTIVNLVFAAVNFHLEEVESRQTKYDDVLRKGVSAAASVPTDVATGAAGAAGAGLASGTITKFCDILMNTAVSKYSSVHQDVEPHEMRERYATLFLMVSSEHSTNGRFVISQPIFTENEVEALNVDLNAARPVQEEKDEEVRSAGTIRVQWAEKLDLSDDSLKAIYSARIAAGDSQQGMFLSSGNMNPLKATSTGSASAI